MVYLSYVADINGNIIISQYVHYSKHIHTLTLLHSKAIKEF